MKRFEWKKHEEYWYAYYRKEELGFIEYYSKWKKFIWNQHRDIVMSVKCLEKVCKKLKELGNK